MEKDVNKNILISEIIKLNSAFLLGEIDHNNFFLYAEKLLSKIDNPLKINMNEIVDELFNDCLTSSFLSLKEAEVNKLIIHSVLNLNYKLIICEIFESLLYSNKSNNIKIDNRLEISDLELFSSMIFDKITNFNFPKILIIDKDHRYKQAYINKTIDTFASNLTKRTELIMNSIQKNNRFENIILVNTLIIFSLILEEIELLKMKLSTMFINSNQIIDNNSGLKNNFKNNSNSQIVEFVYNKIPELISNPNNNIRYIIFDNFSSFYGLDFLTYSEEFIKGKYNSKYKNNLKGNKNRYSNISRKTDISNQSNSNFSEGNNNFNNYNNNGNNNYAFEIDKIFNLEEEFTINEENNIFLDFSNEKITDDKLLDIEPYRYFRDLIDYSKLKKIKIIFAVELFTKYNSYNIKNPSELNNSILRSVEKHGDLGLLNNFIENSFLIQRYLINSINLSNNDLKNEIDEAKKNIFNIFASQDINMNSKSLSRLINAKFCINKIRIISIKGNQFIDEIFDLSELIKILNY